VAETSPPQIARTLFHPEINHYFVTAGEREFALVLDDWWYTSDRGFYVWTRDSDAPAAAVPVCRFYSFLVNSHFYTAGEAECELLKQNGSGWIYEGIAFQALVPTGGACPAGTDPVWRLYNNRFEQLDSNHRFVASSETYRTMMAAGWIGEGIAFCSPPVSEAEG
jgi:serine protease